MLLSTSPGIPGKDAPRERASDGRSPGDHGESGEDGEKGSNGGNIEIFAGEVEGNLSLITNGGTGEARPGRRQRDKGR